MFKNSINVIVVDDEAPAREEILHLLNEYPELEVIATARDGIEAEKLIKQNKIDIAFFDIQMPGINGIELARKLLNQKIDIQIIFTTAYDAFAVEAFEVHAIDYLLKPLRVENLKRSICRVKENLESKVKVEQQNNNIKEFIDNYLNLKNGINNQFISVYKGDQIIPIHINKIIYAEARGRFVCLITSCGDFKTNINFKQAEEILIPPTYFVCHRSFIININCIESIELCVNNSYQVKLIGSKKLIPVSRNRKDQLQNLLNI